MKIRKGQGEGTKDEGCELMGSWQTVVGDLDTFGTFSPSTHSCPTISPHSSVSLPSSHLTSPSSTARIAVHIIRHPSLSALSSTLQLNSSSPPPPTNPFLVSRESSLLQEFAFWPARDNPALEEANAEGKREKGGVFELRSYELVPGTMLEWEGAWRRGIEARRRFIVSMDKRAKRRGGKGRRRRPTDRLIDRPRFLAFRAVYRTQPEHGSPKSDICTRCIISGRTR